MATTVSTRLLSLKTMQHGGVIEPRASHLRQNLLVCSFEFAHAQLSTSMLAFNKDWNPSWVNLYRIFPKAITTLLNN